MKRDNGSNTTRREFLKRAPAGVALLGVGCATSRPSALNTLPAAAPAAPAAAIAPKGKIPLRVLGKTGVQVSMLGFGGGKSFLAGQDPPALIERAIAAGVTYFDTAASYGTNRESEKIYGTVLPRYRKDIFLASKTEDRTYDSALRSVEESLRGLKTDYLDLIQIHAVGKPDDDPTAWDKPGGVLTALRRLKSEKVVRFVGFTGHKDANVHKGVIESLEFDTVLMALNAAKYKPFREVALPAAVAKGLGIIAMKTTRGLVGQGENKATPRELLAYVWDLPIAVVIIGMESPAIFDENLALAQSFQPKAVDTAPVTARLHRSVTAEQLGWAVPGYIDACV